MNRTAPQLPSPDIVPEARPSDFTLCKARGHEVARLSFRFRPYPAAAAKPRDDLGVAGRFLAEVAFAHASMGKERLDIGQEFRVSDVAHA